MDKVDNPRVNMDTSGLRNRLNNQSLKDNKENHSDENEFEFEEPSLLSANSELDACEKDDSKTESPDLIDFTSEIQDDTNEKKKLVNSNGEQHTSNKRDSLKTNSPKAKFGCKNNYFRFNFQMPKIIKTPDKVDENKENFLTETVYTPSKRYDRFLSL